MLKVVAEIAEKQFGNEDYTQDNMLKEHSGVSIPQIAFQQRLHISGLSAVHDVFELL